MKMKWILVNEQYLDYLRTYERRIPFSNYGNDKFKPFFGILFETECFYYITQVSHPKPRHKNLGGQKDFHKIYDIIKDNKKLIAVVNLNYMFPIPKSEVYEFQYKKIDTYRTFVSEQQKSKYINILKREMRAINNLNLPKDAEEIYKNKYLLPYDTISLRCLDFKQLEKYGELWISKQEPI